MSKITIEQLKEKCREIKNERARKDLEKFKPAMSSIFQRAHDRMMEDNK